MAGERIHTFKSSCVHADLSKGVFLHLRGSLLRLHTACLRVCLTLDSGEGPDWVCPDSPHSRGSLSLGLNEPPSSQSHQQQPELTVSSFRMQMSLNPTSCVL